MKKLTVLLAMIAALTFSLSACGAAQPVESKPVTTPPMADEPVQTYTLTIHYIDEEGNEILVTSEPVEFVPGDEFTVRPPDVSGTGARDSVPAPSIRPEDIPHGNLPDGSGAKVQETNQSEATESAMAESVDAEYVPHTYPKTDSGDPDWSKMSHDEIIRCLDHFADLGMQTDFDRSHSLYFDARGHAHGPENGGNTYYFADRGVVYEARNAMALQSLQEWLDLAVPHETNTLPEIAGSNASDLPAGVREVGRTNRVTW